MKLTNFHRDAFVRSVMNDVPSVGYAEQIMKIAEADAASQLPAKVQALWNDKTLRPFVKTQQQYHPASSMYLTIPSKCEGRVVFAQESQIASLAAKNASQKNARNELEKKVRAAAYSCTTRKQLADLLPEMVKYLPPEEAPKSRMVPAVTGLVTDLMQAGWPKGQKPEAVAAPKKPAAKKRITI